MAAEFRSVHFSLFSREQCFPVGFFVIWDWQKLLFLLLLEVAEFVCLWVFVGVCVCVRVYIFFFFFGYINLWGFVLVNCSVQLLLTSKLVCCAEGWSVCEMMCFWTLNLRGHSALLLAENRELLLLSLPDFFWFSFFQFLYIMNCSNVYWFILFAVSPLRWVGLMFILKKNVVFWRFMCNLSSSRSLFGTDSCLVSEV